MHFPAYYHASVQPADAKDSHVFAAIRDAANWQYAQARTGGTIATLAGASRDPDDYGAPRALADGLVYMPPRQLPSLYDLIKPDARTGADVRLACGLTLCIPPALLTHRQFLFSGTSTIGGSVTTYGQAAERLQAIIDASEAGISVDTPELRTLLLLAIQARYYMTAELLDDLGIIAIEDIDPILAAVFGVVEKKTDQGPSDNSSQPSASTGAS